MKECASCVFHTVGNILMHEYGGHCQCPPQDKWYNCPIEAKKLENIKMLEEYAEWEGRRCRKE